MYKNTSNDLPETRTARSQVYSIFCFTGYCRLVTWHGARQTFISSRGEVAWLHILTKGRLLDY